MKEHRVYVNQQWIAEENCLNFDEWYEYERENGRLHKDAEIWIADCEREGYVYSLEGFAKAFNEGFVNEGEEYFYTHAHTIIYITNKY